MDANPTVRFPIKPFLLARFEALHSSMMWRIKWLSIPTGLVFAFLVNIIGFEPIYAWLIVRCLTNSAICYLTVMCEPCSFISFWDTKCYTPHAFCLASYSTEFQDSVIAPKPATLYHSKIKHLIASLTPYLYPLASTLIVWHGIQGGSLLLREFLSVTLESHLYARLQV